MKMRLGLTKGGLSLYTHTYDVVDADSFGRACADAWSKLVEQQMSKETSIGALMEHLSCGMLDQLDGMDIRVERVP